MNLLATLEDFAAYRQVDFDPTDLAAIIALETASDAVRRYTGRLFDLVEDDEVALNGTGLRSLLLPERPVTEVTEVITHEQDGTDEITLDPATDYLFTPAGVLWRRDPLEVWPRGILNIAVVYTHGFAAMPADVVLAVMQIASRATRQSATVAAGTLASETLGAYSVTYADGSQTSGRVGVTVEEVSLLAPWRSVMPG